MAYVRIIQILMPAASGFDQFEHKHSHTTCRNWGRT